MPTSSVDLCHAWQAEEYFPGLAIDGRRGSPDRLLLIAGPAFIANKVDGLMPVNRGFQSRNAGPDCHGRVSVHSQAGRRNAGRLEPPSSSYGCEAVTQYHRGGVSRHLTTEDAGRDAGSSPFEGTYLFSTSPSRLRAVHV
jgi:hypothetical protein